MSVSLSKGQRVSLAKTAGASGELASIIMGLGWDISPEAGTVDLDASCAMFDAQGNPLETVYFGNKQDRARSIIHSGDNLTGAGDGDDEQIRVDLSKVPANVANIVFTVTSYRGQEFTVVRGAFCRVINGANNQEICKYQLSVGFKGTALILARLYRHNGEWKIATLGEPADGRTIADAGLQAKIKTLL